MKAGQLNSQYNKKKLNRVFFCSWIDINDTMKKRDEISAEGGVLEQGYLLGSEKWWTEKRFWEQSVAREKARVFPGFLAQLQTNKPLGLRKKIKALHVWEISGSPIQREASKKGIQSCTIHWQRSQDAAWDEQSTCIKTFRTNNANSAKLKEWWSQSAHNNVSFAAIKCQTPLNWINYDISKSSTFLE